ncbi:LLM class flavin-dependent oxidoreductase [Jiangella anatolica]|uniref:LLM class flavin-dependent oxidoreductase n=1 Tax=Jiangella anatolica TaxID=2670374 RepID=UPI001314B148|nr:LLM class flavin-dependent oxidoreductase [Jiangella anatolica]
MSDERRRPVKVGLLLPHLEGSYLGGTARWADLATLARTAEDAGFDSLWLADHLLYRIPDVPQFGVTECWSLMAALAAVTNRVELGTLVTVTPWRNPGLFAKMVDAVEEISDGRVILGLGAGSHEPEFPAFGYDSWDHKVSRFEEEIGIIHTLLRTGRIDHQGRFHTLRDCELRPRGPRPGGPPIMVGAVKPRMLRILATYADEWNLPWHQTVEELVAATPKGDEACAAAGRDPATLKKSACLQVDLPDAAAWPGHELLRSGRRRAIRGEPADVAETLRGYAAAGVSHIQVWLDPNTVDGIEWFAAVLADLDRG